MADPCGDLGIFYGTGNFGWLVRQIEYGLPVRTEIDVLDPMSIPGTFNAVWRTA